MSKTAVQNELNILLIEDNQDHAELVKRSLEDHRFPSQIHHLEDGATALDYLREGKNRSQNDPQAQPDLILLDLKLPKVNGHEVLTFLKTDPELRKIPVIILTTSHDTRDVNQAYANHVNSYLVKPVIFNEFSNLLNDLGVYWLGRNTFS